MARKRNLDDEIPFNDFKTAPAHRHVTAWFHHGITTNFESGNAAYQRRLDWLFSDSTAPRPHTIHPNPQVAFRVDLSAKTSRFSTCAVSIAEVSNLLRDIRFHANEWSNSRRLLKLATDLGSECYSFKLSAKAVGESLNEAARFGFKACPITVGHFIVPVDKRLKYLIAFRGRYVHDKEHADIDIERLEVAEMLTLGDRSTEARAFVRAQFYSAKRAWLNRSILAREFAYDHLRTMLDRADGYYEDVFCSQMDSLRQT